MEVKVLEGKKRRGYPDAARVCPKCGKSVLDVTRQDYRLCPYCGTRFSLHAYSFELILIRP